MLLTPILERSDDSQGMTATLPKSKPVSERESRPEGDRRLLLLEDDEEFEAILRGFLEQQSYLVTSVRNGVDGVREVLAKDFDVIVCDMLMPGLPGDMFYAAVKRLKPHLCEKFVFISGMQGNPKVNKFIQQVHGIMIAKPFRMDLLVEVISIM